MTAIEVLYISNREPHFYMSDFQIKSQAMTPPRSTCLKLLYHALSKKGRMAVVSIPLHFCSAVSSYGGCSLSFSHTPDIDFPRLFSHWSLYSITLSIVNYKHTKILHVFGIGLLKKPPKNSIESTNNVTIGISKNPAIQVFRWQQLN